MLSGQGALRKGDALDSRIKESMSVTESAQSKVAQSPLAKVMERPQQRCKPGIAEDDDAVAGRLPRGISQKRGRAKNDDASKEEPPTKRRPSTPPALSASFAEEHKAYGKRYLTKVEAFLIRLKARRGESQGSRAKKAEASLRSRFERLRLLLTDATRCENEGGIALLIALVKEIPGLEGHGAKRKRTTGKLNSVPNSVVPRSAVRTIHDASKLLRNENLVGPALCELGRRLSEGGRKDASTPSLDAMKLRRLRDLEKLLVRLAPAAGKG